MANDLTASYRRSGETRWEGVVKFGNEIVWCCGHSHKRRDNNHSKYFGHEGAAMYCAKNEIARRLKCEDAA